MRKKIIVLFAAVLSSTLFGCSDTGTAQKYGDKEKAEQLMAAKCTVCHSSEKWNGTQYTPEQWDRIIESMGNKPGADFAEEDLQMLKHLVK